MILKSYISYILCNPVLNSIYEYILYENIDHRNFGIVGGSKIVSRVRVFGTTETNWFN